MTAVRISVIIPAFNAARTIEETMKAEKGLWCNVDFYSASTYYALGIAIESRVTWERGGVSLYFRDPDGRSVELATPGLWPSY